MSHSPSHATGIQIQFYSGGDTSNICMCRFQSDAEKETYEKLNTELKRMGDPMFPWEECEHMFHKRAHDQYAKLLKQKGNRM